MSRICSIIGIKFFFFSYLEGENNRFKESRMDGFLNENTYINTVFSYEKCERHKNPGVPFWICGIDRPPHPGLHSHIHYAELFIAGIKDKSL
jgi:hypothetical protein